MTIQRTQRAKRPIRLTYLITDLEVGGVPLHLYRLATRLPADHIRVRVISLADEGPVGDMLRRAGISVLCCGARSAWDLRALWRLWQLLWADPPDILHAMLFHANIAARLIGPLAGVPIDRIMCEIQTVEVERRWHLVVDNLTCRLCRYEFGNSPSVLEHLHRRGHLPQSRLRLEWGAVDFASIDAAAPSPGVTLKVALGDILIVWTGRLDPIKGFEEMLAGFALVRNNTPVKLLLVGEGQYRPTIERIIRDYALTDSVTMLGARNDVPALLKAADLFLFCSRSEGLPNALLEAMAAGMPIVATDVPGCRDLIVDGVTGVLVKSRSPEDIARGIVHILENREQARLLGRQARAWVQEHADIQWMVGRWMRVYEVFSGISALSS